MNEIRQTIGFIKCPICGDRAEVRRNKRGKLYYLGAAGMITPNKPAGQDWILEHMQALNPGQIDEVNTEPAEYGQRVATVKPTEPASKQTPPPAKQEESSWTLM